MYVEVIFTTLNQLLLPLLISALILPELLNAIAARAHFMSVPNIMLLWIQASHTRLPVNFISLKEI